MRNDNNIWNKFLTDLVSYLKSKKYDYIETNLEFIRKVDSIDEINPNIDGLYLKNLEYYDQDKNYIGSLSIYNKFKIDQIEMFVDSNSNIHEINEQFNNSIIGDEGIFIDVGDISDDNLYQKPTIKIMMGEEKNVSMLEDSNVDRAKQLNFVILLIVDESNTYGGSGYNETDKVMSIVKRLLYEYFESFCELDITNRITEWDYDTSIVDETERPVVLSVIENRIIYR